MANERITEGIVRDHFKNDPVFSSVTFEEQKSSNSRISSLLKSASKNISSLHPKAKSRQGFPEFILSFPSNSNYLIVVECKASTANHESANKNNPKLYAVDGVLHYAKHLAKDYNVIAIAVSGETKEELNVSTFYWKKDEETYSDTKDKKLLALTDYFQIFEDQFFISNFFTYDLSYKARKLNDEYQSYSIPTTIRCTMVSGFLLSLLDNSFRLDYPIQKNREDIVQLILAALDRVLEKNDDNEIVQNKSAMIAEYQKLFSEPLFIQETIKHKKRKVPDNTLTVIKNFIDYLHKNVFPLIKHANIGFDILGRFYTEFIRYAGSQQKQGLVLTPAHITQLFCDLSELSIDDIVYDPCCGTGGFIIAALERMFQLAGNDQAKRNMIRRNQIYGVELRPDMFTYACSGMKFRGDGKSHIFCGDCFQFEKTIKDNYKPTIAFLNPPYDHGLAKQMEFVEHALRVVAPQKGTVIAIVQQSCCYKDNKELNAVKQRILKNHYLKAVLSMPVDLFYPVGVVTSIMVFKAGVPNKGRKTWLGYFRNDGFIKKKHLGRIDSKNQYKFIHDKWLSAFFNQEIITGLSVKHEMGSHIEKKKVVYDEWCAEAYMETDFSNITKNDFAQVVKNYAAYKIVNDESLDKTEKTNLNHWHEFRLDSLFKIVKGNRLTKENQTEGNTPYIGAIESNNGLSNRIGQKPKHKGNTISLTYNGSVGEAFYQPVDFWATDDVNVLYPLNAEIFNKYIGLFICTVIRQEKYKFSYGRKWTLWQMNETVIKLPAKIKQDGTYEPDWQYMENFIKDLPYVNYV